MEPLISRLRQRFGDLETWAASHARVTVLGIVLVSVLLRACYLAQINAGPCVEQHRWDATDMNFFDSWARLIAAGNVWSDAELHPYHDWHRQVAENHFRSHTNDPALALGGAAGKEPGHALWNRWYGGKTFHQEPLYPYLLALTYSVFGPDVRAVFVWQVISGVLTNVLIFAIARRVFGPLAGLVAGGLAVLCAPMLYYEAILLREALIVTATVALVYAGLRAYERRSWDIWLAFGVLGGLSLLVKSTFVIFLLLVALVALWRERHDWRAALKAVGPFAAGVALCLAPALVRNYVVGAPVLSLSSVGPVTFVSANTVDYSPKDGFFVSMMYVPRIMAEAEGSPATAAIATLRTHPDVASFLDLQWHKLLTLWHWYEIPNNSNFYLYRLHCPVLKFLPVGFTFAAPLALVGMIMAWKLRHSAWLLYLAAATSVLTMIVFYVLSRFRVPLLAVFLPFAGFAIIEIVRYALAGRHVHVAATIALYTAIVIWTARPLPADTSPIRVADWIVSYNVGYVPRLDEARQRNDWYAIAGTLDDALKVVPAEVERALSAGRLSGRNDAPLVDLFAKIYEFHAQALRQVGREEEARRSEERCRRLRELAPSG